jgi:hypothetical protein
MQPHPDNGRLGQNCSQRKRVKGPAVPNVHTGNKFQYCVVRLPSLLWPITFNLWLKNAFRKEIKRGEKIYCVSS